MRHLYGTWKLQSLEFVMSDTGERRDMYGADPLGAIVITPDNRMMAIITSQARVSGGSDSAVAALFKTMMAYSGPIRVEGDQFITTVEIAWHPGWVGTEQARFFSIADDILSITSAEILHPMFPNRKGRGVLQWQRVSAF